MRKTLGVCLLALLLTGSASAGIMQNGSPTPPPTSTAVTDGATLNGDIHTTAEPETLTQIALELLAVLPSLL